MTDHYETLGVARDATAEDIKRAWRRASSKAHPDRAGGDAEAMAKINRAYEVLGDAERRKAYDETGNDGQLRTPADDARDLLLKLIAEALESVKGNLVDHLRRCLDDMAGDVLQHRKKVTRKREQLVKRRDKIQVTEGVNLVHMLIDQQLAEADQALATLERATAVREAAVLELKRYSSTEVDEASDLQAAMIAAFGRSHGVPESIIRRQAGRTA